MAKELGDVMAALPEDRQNSIEIRAMELATLKVLRISAQQSQVELAAAMGIGQDAISRLERRSDMLLSTLRHYVEGIGGGNSNWWLDFRIVHRSSSSNLLSKSCGDSRSPGVGCPDKVWQNLDFSICLRWRVMPWG